MPSFGAPLPTVPLSTHLHPKSSTTKNYDDIPSRKRKRTSNILGLTPSKPEVVDSDEDIDEEAVFANTGGP